MPAIASLDDLKAAQQDLLQAKDLDELKVLSKSGVASGGKMFVTFGSRSAPPNN